jgi:hypothetical protein
METLDRFIAACVTGEPRKAVSFPGFCALYGNWPDPFRRIVELGTVHPEAQAGFLDTWRRAPTYMFREYVGDDDLYFRGLRVLLPSYDGPPTMLYRGQVDGDPIGTSWSRSYHIAKKFALYSWNNVNPITLKTDSKPRENSVVLRTLASVEIICAPCKINQWKFKEGEFILDPRGLEYEREPDRPQEWWDNLRLR